MKWNVERMFGKIKWDGFSSTDIEYILEVMVLVKPQKKKM